MDHIWAPWRLEYIRKAEKTDACFLCAKAQQNQDKASYILYRGKSNFVMLNLFPYNPGHILVVPYKHTGDLNELTPEEIYEHFDLIRRSINALSETIGSTAYNTGMNLGKVAGAGLVDHVHTHIVPRWQGDTNFMPVLAGTRVIPEAIDATYKKLEGHIK